MPPWLEYMAPGRLSSRWSGPPRQKSFTPSEARRQHVNINYTRHHGSNDAAMRSSTSSSTAAAM